MIERCMGGLCWGSARRTTAALCAFGAAIRATAESIGDECASATAECSLRRFAVVVLQEAAQASAADDVGQWYQVGLLLSFPAAWQKQPVVQTLMWSFGMIMLDKFLAEM